VSASATIERPDVEAYLAAVRDALADLGAEERDELLADVEASILESAEESDAPIAARLGPPADFATELRVAAGLGGATAAPRTWRRPSLEELRSDPRVAAASRVARELAPIWWVARAYVVVALIGWLADGDRSTSPPETFRLGGPELGLALLALALTASLALGLWQRRHDGRLAAPILAVNLVLAVLAVPVYDDLLDWLKNPPAGVVIVDEQVVQAGVAHDGLPVENIYAYSRDGRLLLDVLLFDQNGRPLLIRPGGADLNRRVLRTGNGREIRNAYPIRYYEPGTQRVANPRLAPPVRVPRIATPPLETERPARTR
jgi:HAAS domain-containing protein